MPPDRAARLQPHSAIGPPGLHEDPSTSTSTVCRPSQLTGSRMPAVSLARQESTDQAPVLEAAVPAPLEPAASGIPWRIVPVGKADCWLWPSRRFPAQQT